MHKLDPIERLPDGSFFCLTPGQLRSVRGLTKRCCNFLDGDCLLLDGACPQHISRSLLCRWFRRAVLPRQPKLEQAILSPKKLRRCEICGKGILAHEFADNDTVHGIIHQLKHITQYQWNCK